MRQDANLISSVSLLSLWTPRKLQERRQMSASMWCVWIDIFSIGKRNTREMTKRFERTKRRQTQENVTGSSGWHKKKSAKWWTRKFCVMYTRDLESEKEAVWGARDRNDDHRGTNEEDKKKEEDPQINAFQTRERKVATNVWMESAIVVSISMIEKQDKRKKRTDKPSSVLSETKKRTSAEKQRRRNDWEVYSEKDDKRQE